MASRYRIRVLDVIRWSIHEDIGKYITYRDWAQQGLDHRRRFAAFLFRSNGDLDVLRSAWLQPEAQASEEMYWVASAAKMNPDIKSVPSLSERIERSGIAKMVDGRMAEERGHEVSGETEVGRPIIERLPPGAQSAQHSIHGDILGFIQTGNLPASSSHISPLLAPINTANVFGSTTQWSPIPLATADINSIVLSSDDVV